MVLSVGNKLSKEEVRGAGIAEDSKDILLPVEGWMLVESFDLESRDPVIDCDQHWLRIIGTQVSIFKAPTNKVSLFATTNEISTLELGTDISSVEIPRLSNNPLSLLAFGLGQTNATKALFEAYVGMGAEHPKPGIAFKISKECLDWSQPSRKQIADLFKARHTSICYLDDAALGARWKRLTSACSRNCVMDLVHVETYHTDTEGNKQSRPPELNLMARTKRGGAYTSNSRIGKRKRVEILSSTTSPPPQTPRGRPKPRPTYVGAEDDSGEPRGSCDRASERHGAPSSRRFILPNNGTPLSPGVNKPLVVKPSVAATSSSWDRLRVGSRGHSGDSIAETERLAKSKGRLMTELILDSEFAATETHAGTASEFLSRNHEEVRDALQQALHLLDNP